MSHLSTRIISLFEANIIIYYAIPCHTSDRTRAPDVGIIMTFSRRENCQSQCQPFDPFDFVAILTESRHTAITHTNIIAGFRKPVLGQSLVGSKDDT